MAPIPVPSNPQEVVVVKQPVSVTVADQPLNVRVVEQPQGSVLAKPSRVKWEYTVLTYQGPVSDLAATLNGIGDQGWELVMQHNDGSQLVFKRPEG